MRLFRASTKFKMICQCGFSIYGSCSRISAAKWREIDKIELFQDINHHLNGTKGWHLKMELLELYFGRDKGLMLTLNKRSNKMIEKLVSLISSLLLREVPGLPLGLILLLVVIIEPVHRHVQVQPILVHAPRTRARSNRHPNPLNTTKLL